MIQFHQHWITIMFMDKSIVFEEHTFPHLFAVYISMAFFPWEN